MMTLAGAVGIALLALAVELLLEWLESLLTPKGARGRDGR
jgi:ABC-type proline/glycine betaine transport system permease subunit